MKKIITAIAVLVSLSASAQDSSYNATLKFNITDSVENGITFQRKAFFETMIYNQRILSISLQFRVEFYNTDGTKKMNSARPYWKEINITNDNYVVTATGVKVGLLQQVLALYGKVDNTPPADTSDHSIRYIKFSDGRYDLTTACMGEYDYLCKGFDNNQKLHATIKAIGQREASAGKLN